MSGYYELLAQQGFFYEWDFEDDIGDSYTVFEHSNGMQVIYGISESSLGVPCILIMVSK